MGTEIPTRTRILNAPHAFASMHDNVLRVDFAQLGLMVHTWEVVKEQLDLQSERATDLSRKVIQQEITIEKLAHTLANVNTRLYELERKPRGLRFWRWGRSV